MRALRWARRHWWVFVAVVLVAFMARLAAGAVEAGDERRESRARIEALAQQIADGQIIMQQSLDILRGATSPEAQARQAATLARVLAELRKSINCVGLYTLSKDPPACQDTDDRMERLLAGEDPFGLSTPPPAPSEPPGGP